MTLLAALMIAAPAAAQKPLPAKLPFSPAIRVGDMLYMSGQIGQVPDGMDPHKEGFDAARSSRTMASTSAMSSNAR